VLRRYEESLPEFLNVSQATVQIVGATQDSAAIIIQAKIAEGNKCARCWRVVSDVGADSRWPSVCARCAEALGSINFPPTGETP
jgi:isoleucyl-tRNA synthetase